MNREEFLEEFGYDIESVSKLRNLFKSQRKTKENVWKTIDAYDSGEFWDTLRKKLPKHYVIPDTNMVFYIGDNIVGSTYSAPFFADVLPVDPGDQDESRKINKFLEYVYNKKDMGYKQLKLGIRASRLNVGWLQLGWNANIEQKVGGTVMKGDIEYTPRDTMSVLIDPNFPEYQEGRALFILTEDDYESVCAEYPEAKKDIDDYFKAQKEKDNANEVTIVNMDSQDDVGKGYLNPSVTPTPEGMLPIYIAFKKVAKETGGYRIDQIIYINDDIILQAKKGIKPNYYPIIPLYCLPPIKDGYGIGVIQRILKNALSLNILDTIAVSHVYASQRTPMVLDLRSGIHPGRLKRDMNNPDRVFATTGEVPVDKVIQRLEYANLPPNLQHIRDGLLESIKLVTSVDEKYTGRDTASVTTTGGMERLQSRVSMTDNTRIAMIEMYSKLWTKMSLDFFILFGKERTFATNASYEEQIKQVITLDFSKYKDYAGTLESKFPMHINASPLLPKNRARLAEAANMIMQVQMQYQGQIQLLTPEEWLFYQDFPQKDMILDRMKMDRLRNDKEDITAELQNFAGLTEQGVRPEAAVDQLAKERAANREPAVVREQLKKQMK